MSAEQLLSKFDYDKFLWKPSNDEPSLFQRPLAGVELVQDLWNRFEKGGQTLFVALNLVLVTPTSEALLREAARRAWIALRHQIPIVATSIDIDENENPILKYRVPNTHQVDEWAARTLVVHTQTAVDLYQVHAELGDQKIPSADGDQTWMHLILPSSPAEIDQIGFIFHTHHSITDGHGSQILVNAYLTEFGQQLGNTGAEVQFRWGEEVDRLPPDCFTILNPAEPLLIKPDSTEEPSFGDPVYGTLGAEMQRIGDSMQNVYGFKPRDGDKSAWPAYRHIDLEFSEDESKHLLAYMKEQPHTLTVLAHAALAMVVMSNNPPSSEFGQYKLNNFTLLDVRHRLREPFSSRHGFAGYALSTPIFQVPVSLFLGSDGMALPLDRATLLKVMEDVGPRYKAQRDMPPGYLALAAEVFCQGLKQGYAANLVPPAQCYTFSSDGRGENKLDSMFHDKQGRPMFKLARFFTSISRIHPAPFFRLSSWQGVIDLGSDYNENLISREEVEAYLAKWKEFMGLVIQ
ncbi:hypothetical protein FB45DRAFT_928849 [Roridomyces roridus]|uniref:Uncharacterized protein n=1 Tax=Roridomyces roridus TaxID=1738132 RepID=A0AAD7BHJ4_9AGAR|nr:hypothetical protein FB45DRAFT_928849 [Roridomyces roridus]